MHKSIVTALKNNRSLLVFVLLMFVFRSSLADWNQVPTGSMVPTIVEGDRIFVNKMAYDIRVPFTHISLYKVSDPQRGDIVVFDSQFFGKRLVKRVIGLPGDTVALRNNVLMINGKELPYENLSVNSSAIEKLEFLTNTPHVVRLKPNGSALSNFNPVVVPAGHYLALGDSRDNSADSRVTGFVPRNEIVGRTRSVVWSVDYENYHLPRSERFFHTL